MPNVSDEFIADASKAFSEVYVLGEQLKWARRVLWIALPVCWIAGGIIAQLYQFSPPSLNNTPAELLVMALLLLPILGLVCAHMR